MAPILERVIDLNGLAGCHYFEPYAGGASLALSLLFQNLVSDIHLNDLDPAIHACWSAILHQTSEFVDLVTAAEITPAEWARQKATYKEGQRAGTLALGFATFFLNRTNHSGILNGGMIGGKSQEGPWTLDCRFNKAELLRRIERIGSFRERIHLSSRDAAAFLENPAFPPRSLLYLDPPYFNAGAHLYLNTYRWTDHACVRRHLDLLANPWVVSYDDTPEIRTLYGSLACRAVTLQHTARSSRVGRELLFFSPGLAVPGLS